MNTNINTLVAEILKEAKRQKDYEKEITENVFQTIDGLKQDDWKLSFRWYSRIDGAEMISFSKDYVPENIQKWQKENNEKSQNDMTKAINYLISKGKSEDFFNYLCKNALPQFLQGNTAYLEYRVK